MNELKKIESRITEIDRETSELAKKKECAEIRLEQAETRLGVLWDSMKSEALRGDDKGLKSLEAALAEHRSEVQRDRATAEGATEKLARLEAEKTGLEKRRAEVFTEHAVRWLKAEMRSFDAAAESLMKSRKRLLACHSHLRDVGDLTTYEEVVGEGFRYLPGLKAFTLQNFKRDYAEKSGIDRGISEQVRKEIEGK